MTLKVIFDKEKANESYHCGWGVSFLIDGKILFDTGENARYLLENFKALNVDISAIEKIIISNNYWDHRGGLWEVLAANKNVEIFGCSDFSSNFKDELQLYNFKTVSESCAIAENIYTTGCLASRYKEIQIQEQALLIETEKGTSIICGCAHSGILAFIDKAKDMIGESKIYSVIGGFHLMDSDKRSIRYILDEIKKKGIEKIGPSHCTGIEAINILKQAYKDDFIDIMVGKEIEL